MSELSLMQDQKVEISLQRQLRIRHEECFFQSVESKNIYQISVEEKDRELGPDKEST